MDGDRVVDRAGASGLCLACVDALDVTGAGIMLMTNVGPRGVLCASNPTSGTLEELQFTLGEGPCVDACGSGHPVLEPDVAAPGFSRWPAFTPPAIEAGVRAIFGFPLQVGSIRLGALDIYNDYPGDLRADQLAEALNLAGVVTHKVLELQATAQDGALAPELATPENLRAAVHQASGILSARCEISVHTALLRLRAHAFATGQPINDVAQDVVAGTLNIA
ncbi:MAG: GAF and ANTAR domain-containing protein [Acidimicrobiia bacterium]